MTSPTCSSAAGRVYLAVSFSGPGGSLGLRTDHRSGEINWEKRATASELATVKLAELLAEHRLTLPDITHILVNVGPGSFTGIRVGVNLARTLAYALSVPIAGVDALTTLAHREARVGETTLVALKAVRTHFYAAEFTRTASGLVTTLPPQSFERAELDQRPAARTLIEGETPDFGTHVRALDLVRLHLDLPELTRFFSWRDVNPLYVRGSEAEEKMGKGLLKPL